MKLLDILKLSLYSLWNKKHTTALLVLNFAFIFTFCIFGFMYTSSMKSTLDDVLTKKISEARFELIVPANEKKLIENLDKIQDVIPPEDTSIYSQYPFWEVLDGVMYHTLADELEPSDDVFDAYAALEQRNTELSEYALEIEEKTYQGTNDFSYIFPYEEQGRLLDDELDFTVRFDAGFWYHKRGNLLTPNELKEFAFKFPQENPLVFGREIQNSNEILISDYMLTKFGIAEAEHESLVGKAVTLTNSNGEVLFAGYEIAGILSENVFRIESKRDAPQIIFSTQSDLYKNQLPKGASPRYFVSCNVPSFDQIVELSKRAGSELGVIILKPNEMPDVDPEILENRNLDIDIWTNEYYVELYTELTYHNQIMSFVLLVLGIVLVIATLVNLNNMLLFQISQKEHYYGMLKAVGIKNKDLYLLNFFELEFVQLLSLVVACALGLLLVYLLDSQLASVFYVSLFKNVSQVLMPLLALLVISPVLSALLSVSISRSMRKKGIIQLMNADM
ncbi:MAG: FtsX-like permease family protein [Coriobacteriia bacterium]|nr:FtsX-like permease family protein [Coriobacteriia bacterium]